MAPEPSDHPFPIDSRVEVLLLHLVAAVVVVRQRTQNFSFVERFTGFRVIIICNNRVKGGGEVSFLLLLIHWDPRRVADGQ